ncbi:MAG: aryl-sulfate sulfotransferase [Ignavibacteria bacterium]
MIRSIILLCFFVTLFSSTAFSSHPSTSSAINGFKYIDPINGAKYVNKETSLIIKPDTYLNKRSLESDGALKITGSLGGNYEFILIWSDDNSTLILKPARSFIIGETVTIEFTGRIRNINGSSIKPFTSSFEIQTIEIPDDPFLGFVNELTNEQIDGIINGGSTNTDRDFPLVTVTYSNNPSPGSIFLSNVKFSVPVPNTPYLLILNNSGSPQFSREMALQCFDFKKQPNGYLTYYDIQRYKYYALDTSYAVVDSFYTGNGYLTDQHDLKILSNGHALLMSYDKKPVDMSMIVPGGNPNAFVTGLIIQEIDQNKNVVFQWRSWDHYLITDATHENLLSSTIDYVHGNALFLDIDGTILVSARHMDEITKISRVNGDMIWRLGGKNNQFAFPNDPNKFSHQHDINRISSGNITLFDNGNYHIPQVSRAVEYNLDETNKIATMVWQYHHSPELYGGAMGNVQRLDNGNTLIGWGAANPSLTEVKPDGSKALELTFVTGIFSYRAFKFSWGSGVTGLTHNQTEIPESYVLSQNYPNPFNPATTIKFSIPRAGVVNMLHVQLTVYDALGREVQTLVNENLSPGAYEISFRGDNLPSGVYFYKLFVDGNSITAGFTETKKMLLIK